MERADALNKARAKQLSDRSVIRNDKDTVRHIKLNAETMFQGLFPGKPVPVEEVGQIVESVAERYESLEVLNSAALGEMFEKIIDRFERRWNEEEHIKVQKSNQHNPNDYMHHKTKLDQWERLLNRMNENHVSRRAFLLGLGKGADKDKSQSGEGKGARPTLDLKLDADLQAIQIRYSSYREKAKKQLVAISETIKNSL